MVTSVYITFHQPIRCHNHRQSITERPAFTPSRPSSKFCRSSSYSLLFACVRNHLEVNDPSSILHNTLIALDLKAASKNLLSISQFTKLAKKPLLHLVSANTSAVHLYTYGSVINGTGGYAFIVVDHRQQGGVLSIYNIWKARFKLVSSLTRRLLL